MDAGFVFSLIPIVAIAILAFFIIGFNNHSKQGGRGKGLLAGFNYSVTVTMLAIVVGASVIALNTGLKITVLKGTDYSIATPPAPSWLYSGEPAKDPSVSPVTTVCSADTCSLTDTQKTSIAQWVTEYKRWEESKSDTALTDFDRTQLVSALSFLVVALPLFIVFFRIIQKDFKRGQFISGMRSFYFYGVAVVGLLMTVISAAFIVNSGLRNWISPTSSSSSRISAPYIDGTAVTAVEKLVECGSTCSLSEETVTVARNWLDLTKNANNTADQIKRDLATALPSFAIGLPLFLYHFITIRRETRTEDEPQTPQGTNA